jgi:hypothetical protein
MRARKHTLFVTEMQPNGTRDLLIVDEDNQIVDQICESLYGGKFNAYDRLNGVYGYTNCESIGYFESNSPAYRWDDTTNQKVQLDDSFEDLLVEHVDYQGVTLVFKVTSFMVETYLFISPTNDGSETLDALVKYGFELELHRQDDVELENNVIQLPKSKRA